MTRDVADDDVRRLCRCEDEVELARALAVPLERVRSAVVDVLFEVCTLTEAVAAMATFAAAGDVDGAGSIAEAVLKAARLRPVGDGLPQA